MRHDISEVPWKANPSISLHNDGSVRLSADAERVAGRIADIRQGDADILGEEGGGLIGGGLAGQGVLHYGEDALVDGCVAGGHDGVLELVEDGVCVGSEWGGEVDVDVPAVEVDVDKGVDVGRRVGRHHQVEIDRYPVAGPVECVMAQPPGKPLYPGLGAGLGGM